GPGGVRAGRRGRVEHPARQDPRHGQEEAHLPHGGRRPDGRRFGGRSPLPRREREERQGGRPQTGRSHQGI
ncbi:MAG: hypothetical protein AVDCRST_MAG78-3654, partial [uncultured Rubrobacteraceae bacterium]